MGVGFLLYKSKMRIYLLHIERFCLYIRIWSLSFVSFLVLAKRRYGHISSYSNTVVVRLKYRLPSYLEHMFYIYKPLENLSGVKLIWNYDWPLFFLSVSQSQSLKLHIFSVIRYLNLGQFLFSAICIGYRVFRLQYGSCLCRVMWSSNSCLSQLSRKFVRKILVFRCNVYQINNS